MLFHVLDKNITDKKNSEVCLYVTFVIEGQLFGILSDTKTLLTQEHKQKAVEIDIRQLLDLPPARKAEDKEIFLCDDRKIYKIGVDDLSGIFSDDAVICDRKVYNFNSCWRSFATKLCFIAEQPVIILDTDKILYTKNLSSAAE